MTDTDDQPGTGDPTGAGRRRGVDQVAGELAALRRDLTTHAGLLAELAPDVEDLRATVTGLAGAVEALTAQHADHQQEDAVELDARRQAGLADEPASPWCWPTMTRPDAETAWSSLDRWITTVLAGQYRLPLRRLPGCWPAHPGAVAELTALRAAHIAAIADTAHPTALMSWTRELPGALDRLVGTDHTAGAIDPKTCPPGRHHADPAQLPQQRDIDRVGAMPAEPRAWAEHLRTAVAADLAGRREPTQ